MNWKRIKPGSYRAGPYYLEREVHDFPRSICWAIAGPGVNARYATKAEAQAECQRVAKLRAADPDANAPVQGDFVRIVADGRIGQVNTIQSSGPVTLWCLHLPRVPGRRRLCLARHEIEVVVP